jgi:hypothetical protein
MIACAKNSTATKNNERGKQNQQLPIKKRSGELTNQKQNGKKAELK